MAATRHPRGAVERINALCTIGACLPIIGAIYEQFAGSELPCPLCLLQRMAFLGIGIGCADVKQAFNQWAVLAQAEDLAAIVISKIAGILFEDRSKKASRHSRQPAHIINLTNAA